MHLGLAGCADEPADEPADEVDVVGDATVMEAPAETPAAPAAAPITADGAMLDPDVATRDELLAIGIDDATADAIIAGRPYSDMLAVDRVLTTSMDEAQRRGGVRAAVEADRS